jgi:hypothetical protein
MLRKGRHDLLVMQMWIRKNAEDTHIGEYVPRGWFGGFETSAESWILELSKFPQPLGSR